MFHNRQSSIARLDPILEVDFLLSLDPLPPDNLD